MEAHMLTGWRGRDIFALSFLGLITILAACSPATPTLPPAIEPTARPEIEPPECPECPQTDCPQCPEPTTPEPAGAQIPYYEALWSASADNEFVSCETCHNETSKDPNEITTVAGQKIVLEGSEAACINCHQGGASTITVDDAVIEAGVAGDDEISDKLGVIDIQNFAAATRMGAWAKGGYQYPGKPYEARYAHVEAYDSCADCHDSHTLEIKLEGCGQCHQGVDSADDLARIRGEVSRIDYDGDGNTQEGIVREIEGFQKSLLQAMQSYAENNGATMLYDPNQPPYYFIDADGNGELDESEMIESNLYNAWTARLLRAAYNYHFSMQDKGAFIHNGKYVLQLLYDFIEDLDERLVKKLTRDDPGHFSGSGEAWRHWDEGGEVPRDCARCHSAAGLPTYLTIGRDYPQPVANGMSCTTCHTNLKRHQRHAAQAVKFPGGTTLGIDADNNLCLNCHLGQASAASLEENLESSRSRYSLRGSIPTRHTLLSGWINLIRERSGRRLPVCGYVLCRTQPTRFRVFDLRPLPQRAWPGG